MIRVMARAQIHPTVLAAEDREYLEGLVRHGHETARVIWRANSLLLADDGYPDTFIARTVRAGRDTVRSTRERYALQGLQGSLREAFRPGATAKLDARQEVMLVAITCSKPPEGRDHWTLQLLADKLVELNVVESISDDTVQRALKQCAQTVAEKVLVHHQDKQGLHLADGGRS